MDVSRAGVVVYVESSDARLRRALGARLRQMPGLIVAEEQAVDVAHADGTRAVIVSPSSDMSLARCRLLTNSGARVVVLAPVVRVSEGAAYREAGAAAYLAMDINAATLEDAIGRVVWQADGADEQG